MQVTTETLLAVGLGIIIPLLGVVASALFQIKATLSSFNSTLQKAERSLDHNRNEHTKIINLIEALETRFNDRIELLEERIKHDD